jgi:hypothetical protein
VRGGGGHGRLHGDNGLAVTGDRISDFADLQHVRVTQSIKT